jgi:hypothetical protein
MILLLLWDRWGDWGSCRLQIWAEAYSIQQDDPCRGITQHSIIHPHLTKTYAVLSESAATRRKRTWQGGTDSSVSSLVLFYVSFVKKRFITVKWITCCLLIIKTRGRVRRLVFDVGHLVKLWLLQQRGGDKLGLVRSQRNMERKQEEIYAGIMFPSPDWTMYSP